jgi:ATP-dependent exoDNAse (exonuclease V) beta subunit
MVRISEWILGCQGLIDNSAAVELWWRGENGLRPKQEELLDNINVYVALTRAEEQLYIISNMNLTSRERCS